MNSLISEKPLHDGIQKLYRFENEFGASVVRHSGSFGHAENLYELAVIMWDEKDEWHLCYSTAITDDVIGCLDDIEIQGILGKIKKLKKGETREQI